MISTQHSSNNKNDHVESVWCMSDCVGGCCGCLYLCAVSNVDAGERVRFIAIIYTNNKYIRYVWGIFTLLR